MPSSSASCWPASWPAGSRTSPRPSACPNDRGGRVYLDFLQNGHGKLLAAPFTARPVTGALCSAPLLWDEVDETLDIRAFTIRTLPERMSVFGRDPLAPVLTQKPDLVTALARLSARLAG